MRSPRDAEALERLLGSPFLEGFDPRDLAELARRATVVSFEESERVFTQGNPATCLYLLVAGAVELGKGGGPAMVVQTVTHEGHLIGWSAMVTPYIYRATATAREPTRLLAIGREVLEQQARANPGFWMTLMRAVLGIVGDRLRATRTRLIARRYDDVVVAIRDLLDQSGPGSASPPAAPAPVPPRAPADPPRRLPDPGRAAPPRRPGRARPGRALCRSAGPRAPGA